MSADVWLVAEDCCGSHDHNITHNLGPMFREAGVDWHDYRDADLPASQLAREVTTALAQMADYPEEFRALNPPNGWGTYEVAFAFLAKLLLDCIRHPDARVRVSL